MLPSGARLRQQIRLWLYSAFILGSAILVWTAAPLGPGFRPALFALLAAGMLLPYIEICRECRKVVWLEKGNKAGPLWIGAECRQRPTPKG